jgi:hypothetical protein
VSPDVIAEFAYLVATRLGTDADQRVLAELAFPACASPRSIATTYTHALSSSLGTPGSA